MAESVFVVKSLINHWLEVVDEHSIHSPFFFDIYNKVFKSNRTAPKANEIELVRKKLLANSTRIAITDLGAKSKVLKGNERALSEIAATSLTPSKYCDLYFRLIDYLQAKSIIELGTSLGITSLYLAANPQTQLVTFEGNQALVGIAQTHFEFFEKQNIQIIEGNLDQTLNDYLQKPAKIHFALMDANHRYEPTMRYFNYLTKRIADKGVIVVDDIYHSKEMHNAWIQMQNNELVYGSVDLFKCGILFFDPALNRQHYIWSL